MPEFMIFNINTNGVYYDYMSEQDHTYDFQMCSMYINSENYDYEFPETESKIFSCVFQKYGINISDPVVTDIPKSESETPNTLKKSLVTLTAACRNYKYNYQKNIQKFSDTKDLRDISLETEHLSRNRSRQTRILRTVKNVTKNERLDY